MLKDKKIIIGLVGEAGSGKDTAAKYLKEKFGARSFRYSDVLRSALEVFFEPEKTTREKMIWLSNALRRKYGNQVISEALRRMIAKAPEKMVVLDGLRIAEDVKFLKSLNNTYLIYVTLGQRERWKRNYDRGVRADDAISFEEFQEMEKAETEIQIPELGRYADYRVDNVGTKEELFAKIGEIMSEIFRKRS